METLLIVVLAAGIAYVVGTMGRASQPQVIYVQLEKQEQGSQSGCLPWVIGAVFILVTLVILSS